MQSEVVDVPRDYQDGVGWLWTMAYGQSLFYNPHHNRRDVLRVLSEMSDTNIIYGADVSGFVTIHLDQVPFNRPSTPSSPCRALWPSRWATTSCAS